MVVRQTFLLNFTFILPIVVSSLALQACGSPSPSTDSMNPLGSNQNTQSSNTHSSNENGTDNESEQVVSALSIPGDYPDLPSAFAGTEILNSNSKQFITVTLEPGYEISTSLVLRRGDYSNITIQCSGSIFVSDTFPSDHSLFVGQKGVRMPHLACLFDMTDKGENGYHLTEQSSGSFEENAGIINAGQTAVLIKGNSRLYAPNGKFDGAGTDGVVATGGSQIYCNQCSANEAGGFGFKASEASSIVASAAQANDAGSSGFFASHASTIAASAAQANRALHSGFVASHASSVAAVGAQANYAGGAAVNASDASRIAARQTVANNAGAHGVLAKHSSQISFLQGQAHEAQITGIYSQYASSISANSAEVTDAKDIALRAYGSSLLAAQNVDASDAKNHAVYATMLGIIQFDEGNPARNGSELTTDLFSRTGGMISATNLDGNDSDHTFNHPASELGDFVKDYGAIFNLIP